MSSVGSAFPFTNADAESTTENTEVYNIVCDSLGITPKPNNGTLRLPLKPVGLHSDLPDELPSPDEPSASKQPTLPAEPASPEDPNFPPKDTAPGVISEEQVTNDSMAAETEEQKEEAKEEMHEFWAYVKAKMKAAQEWANKVIASLKANHKGKEKQEQGN